MREGMQVSLRSVRGELGTGSLGTIQKHLSTLRETQSPLQESTPPALSPVVVRAMASEMDRAVAERTARMEGDLKEARTSVDLLVEENEALRTASSEAEAAYESTHATLSEQSGRVATLQVQLGSMGDQLAAARGEAEVARQGLAISREQLHASEERCTLLESELRAARAELVEVRRELTQSRQEGDAARATVRAVQAQLASKQQVEDYLRDAASEAQRLRQDLEEARLRLSGLEVERTSLAERLGESKQALARAEANVQQLLDKVVSGAPLPQPRVQP